MGIKAKGPACYTSHTGFSLQDASSRTEPISLTGEIKKEHHLSPFTTAKSTAVIFGLLKLSFGSNTCGQMGEQKLIVIVQRQY